MSKLSDLKSQYPQYDDMSERDFADRIYSKFYSTMPKDEYYSKVGFDQFEEDRTIAGSVVEFGKAIPRGFAGSFLSAAEGLAELADAGTNAIGLDDLIDSGDDNELVRLAREGRNAVNEGFLKSDVKYQDEWSTKFGEGLGSLASFFTPAGAVKLAGLAGKAASTTQLAGGLTLAGGAGAGDQAQRIQAARDAGIEVSEGEEDASIGLGTLVGFTEMAPVGRLLSKISKSAPKQVQDNIKSRLLSGLKSGGFEGLQEVTANIAQNAIERGIYNEDLAVNDSMADLLKSDEFTVGAASGFVADMVLTSIALRRGRYATQEQKDRESVERDNKAERIQASENAVSDMQREEAQNPEQRLQEEQGIDFQPEEATIDPSQIDIPTPQQITKAKLRRNKYIEVTDSSDPANVKTYQAEERVRTRTVKGKTTKTQYIVDISPNGETREIILSKNGVRDPRYVVQELAPRSENFQSAKNPNLPKSYASHIYKLLGRSFPTAGKFEVDSLPSANKRLELQNLIRFKNPTTLEVDALNKEIETLEAAEISQGEKVLGANQVVHISSSGKKTAFGRNLDSSESAAVMAGRLNEKIIDSQVNNSVAQVINTAPESYSQEVKNTLAVYGDTILHPDESTFTASEIDSASQDTIDKGYQEHKSVKELIENRVPKKLFTASQKLNAKRIAKGLAETNTFTPAEAKSVLGDKFSRLIRPPETLENAIYTVKTEKNKRRKSKTDIFLMSGNGDRIDARPPTTEESLNLQENTGRVTKKPVKFKNIYEASAFAKQLNSSTKSFIHLDSVLDTGTINAKLSVVIKALRQNNITNDIGSPEIRALAENFTGVKATGNRRISDMNQGELKALVSGIRSLPRFDVPTKMPLFRHKRYTSDEFSAALDFVRQNDNDTTNLVGIAESIGLDLMTNPAAQKKAEALSADLKVHIAPVNDMPAIEAASPIPQGQGMVVYEEPAFGAESTLNIDKLRAILKTRMSSFGLGDIGLNVSDSLRNAARNAEGELVFGVVAVKGRDQDGELAFNPDGTPLIRINKDDQNLNSPERIKERGNNRVLGYYSPSVNSVFLGVDAIAGLKNMSPAQQEAAFIETLDHEMIHGMRQLDLWTEKEWQLLSSLATTRRNSSGKTFLDAAKDTYNNDTLVVQVEEAIVEMTREARSDPKVITGKPRTLLNRISEFFTKSVSAINGFGFNSFSSIIEGIESGAIGKRTRGKSQVNPEGPIRTLLETERNQGVPFFNAEGASIAGIAQSDRPEESGVISRPKRGMSDSEGLNVAAPTAQAQTQAKKDFDESGIMESRVYDPNDSEYRYKDDRLPAFRGASEVSQLRNTLLEDATNAGFQSGDLISDIELDLEKMSPQGRRLVKALQKDNFLGFDRYDDAFSALFEEDLSIYDPSLNLKSALGRYVNQNYELGFGESDAEAQVTPEPVQATEQDVVMGVNVATDGSNNYADLIVTGQKEYETRDQDSLRPYVGKRIGIIETKRGEKAKLVGYVTVGEPEVVGQAEFESSRELHLVPEGSKFDIKQGQQKWLYRMIDPQKLSQPIDASKTAGIVARNISDIGGRADAKEFLSEGFTPKVSEIQIPEGAIEKVVEDNVKKTEEMPKNLTARFNPKADPRSQYIAQNPDKGVKFSPESKNMYSAAKEPEYSPEAKAALDQTVTAAPTAPASKAFLKVTETGSIGEFLLNAKAKMINRYARLEQIYTDPNLGFRDVLADSSAFAAAMFADRSKGIAAQAIKSGFVSYKNGLTKVEAFIHNGKTYRGLIDIMSPLFQNKYGANLEKLAQGYAIAIRSKRLREKKGLATPADGDTLDALMPEINKYKDENGNNIVEEWYNTWQAYNKKTVEFLMDTGVLDAETAETWIAQADYVPFYRQAEDPNAPDKMPAIFRGMTSAATFKELKGGDTAVTVPLLDAITRNLDAAISMGMRNVAQQRIVRDMNSLGLAREVMAGQQGNNVISFRVDGKKRDFSIDDPLMFESMQLIGGGSLETMLTSVVGTPSRYLRELITRDPGFMAVNMLRDTLSTFVTSGSSFVPVWDTLKNANSGVDALSKYGIVGGYDFGNDPDNLFKDFEKEMGKRGDGSAGNLFTRVWDFLGDATTASDAATRKAVYDDVLARTGNEAEAAFQALEVINFSRRGNSPVARVVTAAIPFLNARFQGLDVFIRSAKGNYGTNKDLSQSKQMQTVILRGAFLAGLTGIYFLLVSDDEQYKNADEHTRDNNWLIPTPWGVPFKVPIPFEVGLIFKTFPEKALAVATGKATGREAAQSAFTATTGTLGINPLGAQIIKPLIEVQFNHNFFTGNPIVSKYLDGSMEDAFIDRETTNRAAIEIGKQFNISPIKLEHVMKGYTGTIGSYVLDFADSIMRMPALTGDTDIQMPTRPVTEYPVIKRFFARNNNAGQKEDFYELHGEIRKITTTLNSLKKDGRIKEYERYLQGREVLAGMKNNVNYVAKQLATIRNQKELIRRAELSAEEKRKLIDELTENEKQVLKITSVLKRQANMPVIDTLNR